MKLNKQKELAARALGISKKRVKIVAKTAEERKAAKELISRDGVQDLIQEKIIRKIPLKGNSRTRANHILEQKKKGRRSGHGNRKGTANARKNEKDTWMLKIRSLRAVLKKYKDQERLDTKTYRDLYRKAKGNFFRNKRHMSLYMKQNNLIKEVEHGKK